MPTCYLLDTNICSYFQRRQPPEVVDRFENLEPGEAAISVITWGELLYGIEKRQRGGKLRRLLEELASFLPILPMPEEAGKTYGAIRATLERRGTPIGNNDLWIASHAKTEELILVTNNEREFEHVPGLQVENWVAQ